MVAVKLFLAALCFGQAGKQAGKEVLIPDVPDDALLAAMILVESGGNDFAVGDRNLRRKAYGCLQIRQPVCRDVNRHYGTKYRAKQTLGNRQLSIKICRLYLGIWATPERLGRQSTRRDLARIWNGGPNGWKDPEMVKGAKAKRLARNTKKYWEKVKRALGE